MVALALWGLLLPFRIAVLLGLRRTVVVGCLLVLGVTGYGVAVDLGLRAAPARPRPATGQAWPGPAVRADIPPGYLALYQRAAARTCPGLAWSVLAAVGKVESDHGRARLPGVRSGANWAGAAGPMQLGVGGKAGRTWQRYRVDGNRDGRRSVYDPADATATAARYLCAHGAARPGGLRRALFAYNHSAAYVRQVLAIARRYQAPRGGAR